MDLAERAYRGLFPQRKLRQRLEVKYSGHLKYFNANVTSTPTTITFKLSKDFLEVDDELRIGVMQHLLGKLFRRKGVKPQKTLEMDLYERFLKNIGEYKTAGGGAIEDDELRESFERINKEYFHDFVIQPTIRWGGNSKSHLGHYAFSDDTVTISNALRGAGEYLDYVLYHELLHKKHKFEHKGGRTHSHTPAFRKDERLFKMSNGQEPEKALTTFLRGLKVTKKTQPKRKTKSPIRKLLDFF
jgi:hypothetical protein